VTGCDGVGAAAFEGGKGAGTRGCDMPLAFCFWILLDASFYSEPSCNEL